MTSKLYLESISYDQENVERIKQLKYTKPHRKTTTAVLLRNAEATLNDITNSPPKQNQISLNISSSLNQSTSSSSPKTPLKSNITNQSNINILDNTSLSPPKSNRYTISSTTPTKIPHTPNMMTLTHNQPTPSPVVSVAKSLFTPTKHSKLKKKQMEKEIDVLKEKIAIMERLGNDRDSDASKLKITLIDTLQENDRLSKKVYDLEETIKHLTKELDKGSYESWKGYCSLQDSPPGVTSRFSKKRALGANIPNVNFN